MTSTRVDPSVTLSQAHATAAQQRIAALARRVLSVQPDVAEGGDIAEVLVPLGVLALEGEGQALDRFERYLLDAADRRWGLDGCGTNGWLGDAFCMRAVTEVYRALVERLLIDVQSQAVIAAWLYELALIRADGTIEQFDGFEPWEQRNQSVPATMLYEIAAFLDASQSGRFDTAPLWTWADAHMAGWDVTSRSPDDSWLYHFIWLWSAYRHAALRRPALLESDHARQALSFYKILSTPPGLELIFGESHPTDLLGATVGLVLGATLLDDPEQLWSAEQLLARQETQDDPTMLLHRAPELYRLWSLWPAKMQAVLPQRRSCLMQTPQAGRGWSLGETPYNDMVKRSDPRFPAFGRDTCDYDDLYQACDPNAYTLEPDKLVFCESGTHEAMFALADLRAQALHDHPDALNVITLIAQGVPWLVESVYLPRGANRVRWQHNVPLYRAGDVGAAGLKHWRSDTWRHVEPGDVRLWRNDAYVVAAARLRHDAYDYVNFDGHLFDVERRFVFHPEHHLVVIDQLTAAVDGQVTLGQMWHTTADVSNVSTTGLTATLKRDGRTLHASFAHSTPMQLDLVEREPYYHDATYFPGPIKDLLWHQVMHLERGQSVTLAAAFALNPLPLDNQTLSQMMAL